MPNLFQRSLMMNETQIKEIIASFVRQDPGEISGHTIMDRTAMQSSIHIHRMYAALAAAGVRVENHSEIRTFGDLQRAAGMSGDAPPRPTVARIHSKKESGGLSVGIDIEELINFAAVSDYREDAFYQQNFSSAEIAWCILQSNPLASFGGKFAAKEAIIKADNDYRNIPFNRIEILNMPNGCPQFEGFSISISHTPTTAVAVAVSVHREMPRPQVSCVPRLPAHDYKLWVVAIAALVLAIIALLIH